MNAFRDNRWKRNRSKGRAWMGAFLLLGPVMGLWGCGEEAEDDSGLTLQALASTLEVGDTTALLSCTKAMRDATGRMKTTKDYDNFFLVSADTSVLQVVNDRRLAGIKAGSTSVYAKDKASSLSGNKVTIAVE